MDVPGIPRPADADAPGFRCGRKPCVPRCHSRRIGQEVWAHASHGDQVIVAAEPAYVHGREAARLLVRLLWRWHVKDDELASPAIERLLAPRLQLALAD